MKLTRRQFIQGGMAAGATMMTGCQTLIRRATPEIIDCHTHFYDPTRSQGVPWPPREEARLYRRVRPADLKALAAPLGVTGTVVVEASEWIADNQWVLDLAAREPFIVGLVGNIPLDDPDFSKHIRRFARNPLFRGVRVRGPFTAKVTEAEALKSLQVLDFFDLALDYNSGVENLPLVAQVAKQIPRLRIIINHVANIRIDGGPPPAEWRTAMREAAQHEQVFLKVSGLVEGSRRFDGRAPADLDYYRPILDAAWEIFGADRLIYGSNWPVSELCAPYATVFGLIRKYFSAKSLQVERKIFAENAQRAYKWVRREI
jgi:L-fuconolactonase